MALEIIRDFGQSVVLGTRPKNNVNSKDGIEGLLTLSLMGFYSESVALALQIPRHASVNVVDFNNYSDTEQDLQPQLGRIEESFTHKGMLLCPLKLFPHQNLLLECDNEHIRIGVAKLSDDCVKLFFGAQNYIQITPEEKCIMKWGRKPVHPPELEELQSLLWPSGTLRLSAPAPA